MVDVSVNLVAAPELADHLGFGRAVVRWALMKPELRPKTLADVKAEIGPEVIDVPEEVPDDLPIAWAQGDGSKLWIDLPPVKKLLPMLAFLEMDWSAFVSEEELGFDPSAPPEGRALPSDGRYYDIPHFFFEFVRKVDAGGKTDVDYEAFFMQNVAYYCFEKGCR